MNNPDMSSLYREIQKIINLLKNYKIEWGSTYEGKCYAIQIPTYDHEATMNENLTYAETALTTQLYYHATNEKWICVCTLPPHQHTEPNHLCTPHFTKLPQEHTGTHNPNKN